VYFVPDNNGAAHGEVTRIAGFAGGTDLAMKFSMIAVAEERNASAGEEPATSNSAANDSASTGGTSVLPALFEKTNTTLSNIVGLAARVNGGKTYTFEFTGFVTASPVGGYKFAMSCTCRATSVVYDIVAIDNGANTIRVSARPTLFGGNDGNAVATNISARITGTVVVDSPGVLAPQFAQEVAYGTSSVLAGSKFDVRGVN
jgi:hypothetical protein